MHAQAIVSTWKGNDANWTTENEWSPSVFYPNNGNGGNTFDAIINSGTATLTGAITLGNLTVSGGSIAGNADLTVTGDMTWSGGTIAGNGTHAISANSTLTQSNITFLSGGRTLDNAGTANLNGTLFSGLADGAANTITNRGTLTVAGSIAESDATYTLNNSGTLHLAVDASISGNSASMINTGVIQKNEGSGSATIYAGGTFDNSGGSVTVSHGSLNVGFNGPIEGTFQADRFAALNFNQGSFTLGNHTFSGDGAINLTGGELLLSGTPNLIGLTLAGGTVSGDFSQTGSFTLAGSTLIGNVTVGGDFNFTGGNLSGTVTPAGDFNWSGGVIEGGSTQSIASGHTLNQSNATFLNGGRTLDNAGTANITGTLYSGTSDGTTNTVNNSGILNLSAGASLTENSGTLTFSNSGTVTLADDSQIFALGSFTNTGTIQKTVGGGTASLYSSGSFDNSLGTINAQSGAINLNGGGVIAGTYVAGAGGAINFNEGTFTFDSHTFSGDGAFNLTGGELSLAGTPNLAGFNLVGGTVSGNFDHLGSLTLAGSTLTGAVTITGDFNLTAGTLTGTATPTGDFNWSGGSIAGGGTQTIEVGHTLNQSNTTGLGDGSTLENAGTANFAGNLYVYGGGGTVSNSGMLNLSAGASLQDYDDQLAFSNSGTVTLADGSYIGASAGLTNTGTIQKTDGGGTATLYGNGSFDNSGGIISAQTGVINLEGGGTMGGTYTAGDGAVINFNSGTFSLNSATFSGAGAINFTDGELAVSGTANLTGLNLVGGSVTGDFSHTGSLTLAGSMLTGAVTIAGDFNLTAGTLSGTVTPTGAFNWSGGSIAGGGAQTIEAGHTLNQSNTTYLAEGRTLENAGTANFAGNILVYDGGSTVRNSGTLNLSPGASLEDYSGSLAFSNSGTVTLADGSYIIASGSFSNTGTIQKTDGSGTAFLGGSSLDNSGGIIDVQSGTINLSQDFFNAGTLRGSGTFEGALVTIMSGGQISPGNSAGTLTFAGGLTLNDGAILVFELGASSDFIAVTGGTLTGSASPGGITLQITALAGFGVGTYALISGISFDNFDASNFALGAAPDGYTYGFTFDGSTLSLDVSGSAIPEPATTAALAGLASLGLALARRHRRAAVIRNEFVRCE